MQTECIMVFELNKNKKFFSKQDVYMVNADNNLYNEFLEIVEDLI